MSTSYLTVTDADALAATLPAMTAWDAASSGNKDKALLRAFRWLHDVALFPAEGDDTWQPHVINHYYGTSFPEVVPARAGKNVGWTDWTHR